MFSLRNASAVARAAARAARSQSAAGFTPIADFVPAAASACQRSAHTLSEFSGGVGTRSLHHGTNAAGQRRWANCSRGFSSSADADPDDAPVDLEAEQFPHISERVMRLADDICGLTLLEVNDLSEVLKKRLGISDMAMMPMGGMPMPAGGLPAAGAAGGEAAAPAAEEQTEFTVKLESFDKAQKIKVIKEVRAVTELGLKEAKDLVEGAPAVLKKGLKKEDAEAIKEKLAAVGGEVVLE